MAEMKTLNGNTFADTNARARLDELEKRVEPAEDDIPKFFFGSALPQTKDEVVMPFRYISKTQDISGYCETKAQGNSSMTFPKKNQTVKLFKDEACTEKLKVDLKGWGKQNKYCYKANWIDLTHARNVVSARLWADVVKSRADYDDHPDLLRTSPNQGAVDGFPVKVYANGIYQGRYTINIPKDKWTFNMDDDLETHCALCGENYVSGCFRAPAVIDESDWTDEIHDTVPVSILTRWNEVIDFVRTSTDEEFKANLSNYFNVGSLIDYLLFGLASCGLDAFGKNQIYLTYDGQVWYASMYDMDSTWGLFYDGGKFISAEYSRDQFEDFAASTREGNLLYIRLAQLFVTEIQARWAELRVGPLSIVNIINRFERFTDIAPLELVKDDYATTTAGGAFTGIKLKHDINNIQQIRTYAIDRLAYCDEYIANGLVDKEEEEDVLTPVYALSETTTFNGNSDYIDTGVKLFDTAKDFTIVIDGNLGTQNENHVNNVNGDSILRCVHDVEKSSDPKYGVTIELGNYTTASFAVSGRKPNDDASSTDNHYAIILIAGESDRTRIVVRGKAGVVTSAQYKNGSGTDSPITRAVTGGGVYYQHDNTVTLGGGKRPEGTMGYFWGGTLTDFKIYEQYLSDDEVAEYFA